MIRITRLLVCLLLLGASHLPAFGRGGFITVGGAPSFAGRSEAKGEILGPGAQLPEPGAASQDVPAALFQFQGNFWVNLHDVLYRHAQAPQCPQGELDGECAHVYDLTPADQAAWTAAVKWYAANLAKRSLFFDPEMVRINDVLANLAPDDNLDHRGLPDGLVDALRTAAPVFRKYYWPDQEYRNQRWLAAVTPKLKDYGSDVAQRLSTIYGMPWPAQPMRVDLVMYAGPTGAYATLNPLHLVISTANARNQGNYGLEILFLEASHVLVGKVQEGLARESRARNKPLPQDLWHALLFYTTGELFRRRLPGYTPYAEHNTLYRTPGWDRFHDLLERDWKPFLEGSTDRDAALAKLAADF